MHPATTLLLAGVLAAGCAPGPSPSTEAPAPPTEPPLAQRLGVTCGDGAVFDPTLLAEPGNAESGGDTGAAALRAFLALPESRAFPRTGWVRVSEAGELAQFVAPGGAGDWSVVVLRLNNGWTPELAGECQLGVAAPDGTSRADWWLDPEAPRPGPDSRTIDVVLVERACASGRPPEGRVVPPVITASPTEVGVAIFVRIRPGGQDCPGNPEFRMEVDLTEPLGQRRLLDVGVYPPREPVPPAG